MKIKEDFSLKKITTFKTKGTAWFFCEIKNLNDIKKAILFAKEKKVPFYVLGQGSNTLFKDDEFKGLIIKNKISGIEISENKNHYIVSVGAGESWDELVKTLLNKNIFGFENLSGIPGFVGTSIISNIGAYGVEISNFVKKVYVFDLKNQKEKVLNKKECQLSYRESFLKRNKNLIVMKVMFFLPKKWKPKLLYKDLLKLNNIKNISAPKIRKEILKIRKNKLPSLKSFGTAGSFFKNLVLTNKKAKELAEKYPNLPLYNDKKGFKKTSLAFILDQVCHLKGFRKGDIGLYKKQPLVLVTFGDVFGKEILNFSKQIEKKVFSKTKIKIEKEIIVI